MKNILFLTEGDVFHASSRVRVLQYFPYFTNSPFQIFHIARIRDKRSINSKYVFIQDLIFKFTKQFRILKTLVFITFSKSDLIFIQRWRLPYIIRKTILFKKACVIYDLDDAIYQGHENIFTEMLKLSTVIITSNKELENYCKKITPIPVYCIPSPVDTDSIKVGQSVNIVPQIGWIGSASTVKYLKKIEPVFIKLAQKLKFELVVVGAEWESAAYQCRSVNWTIDNELTNLNQIDIGIMPLDNTEWAANKGGYKLFLYMAAGKPIVASPVGINNEIIEPNVNGFLAKNPDEWYNYLSKLITEPDLRQQLGQAGRTKCVALYSYKNNAAALINIINNTIENEC